MEGNMMYMPPDLAYAVGEIAELSRNKFRLETVSADSANPGRIVTFNLPENAIIDTKSIRFFMDVACTGAGTSSNVVYGKLPQNVSSLLARVEVYVNGVSVQQGASEYNTVAQILRNAQSNIDKANSTDRALSHSYITNDNANDDETLCISQWNGFLGENSTRYLNTGLLGQIQVRLTMAPTSVLVPKQINVDVGDAFTGTGATSAQSISYTVSNMYFTVDTLSLSPMYNANLRKRLEMGGLALNYKEYYTFSFDGIASGGAVSTSTRFSLSSGCIDAIYGVFRDSNFAETGIQGFALPNASIVSAYTSNALRFRSYSGQTKKAGVARWNYTINNVKYPQYQASWIDALADVAYTQDKVGPDHSGGLITSAASFNDGVYQNPLLLCLPTDKHVAVQSGYNSRGINSTMVWQASGLVVPAADAALANSGSVSSFVVAETTAQLRIEVGRDLAVMF
jgi:hypothetical protein